ncbi:tetratricopeptide repeat protein [Kordia sp.]|uniref:tetratricopeptide repeat protein n=1 Tax=Kordia sp. TaxID=1965332 RepID=UPI0025C51CAD|nr:tetratricopeptide repeat protein [Kordia sp.]MCH2195884.1 tetratricopeptide repeat protein [Kordia sp.]
MEILQKFFPSVIIVILLSSCEEKVDLKKRSMECFKHGLYYYQGTQESINAFAKAIELDPTHAESWRELSIPFLKRGMPHLWKKYIDKAVELDPIAWQGYRGYNYLWFYRDYKKAIADFDATDTLTPKFIDAPQGHSVNYWRGIAYLGLKDYKNCIAYFDLHIQIEIDELGEDWVELEAFLYRGIAHYEIEKDKEYLSKTNQSKYELALKDFNTILKYFPNFADAKYYKALILFDECESLQLRINFEQQTRSSNHLAKILIAQRQKKQQKALKIIEDAIDNFKNGYSNQRPYVETMRQLYLEDYVGLKAMLEAMK